jgi:hypothetical protein
MRKRSLAPFVSVLLSFSAMVAACSSSDTDTFTNGDAASSDTDAAEGPDGTSPQDDAASGDGARADGFTPTDGGKDAAKDTSPADGGPDTAKPPVCVAGTALACTGAPMKWNATSSLCCIDAPATCKTGVAQADCASVSLIGRYEYWTGAQCCVQQDTLTCSPTGGNKTYCTLAGTHSWPPLCCMNGKYTCMPGTFSSCNSTNFNGSNAIYSGTECCVAGTWSCVAKGAGACPAGTSTSGATCCTKQ